jgi:hypothetical protein
VRVAEDCEKNQRFYTYRNTGRGGHSTESCRGMIGHRYVNCVCRDDASCAYSVKGSWFLRMEGARGGMGWKVDEYEAHSCQGGRPDESGKSAKGKADVSGKGRRGKPKKKKSAAKKPSTVPNRICLLTRGPC